MLLRIKKKHSEDIVDTDRITHIDFYECDDFGRKRRMANLNIGNLFITITRHIFTSKIKQYLHNEFFKVTTIDGNEVLINKRFVELIFKWSPSKHEDDAYEVYIKGLDEPIKVREFPAWTDVINTATGIEVKER